MFLRPYRFSSFVRAQKLLRTGPSSDVPKNKCYTLTFKYINKNGRSISQITKNKKLGELSMWHRLNDCNT